MNRLLLLVVVAGCADQSDAVPSDGPTNDAPPGCAVVVTFDPPNAIATPATEVRAIASVTGVQGVLAYTWQLKRAGVDVPFDFAQADESAISFFAATPGAYEVMVAIGGTTAFCPTGQGTINVVAPNANQAQLRVRVYPPPSVTAPVQERLELVTGGADDWSAGNVTVEQGVEAIGNVRDGATGVLAYLRFMPLGARQAYVEGYSAADGAFRVRVLNQVHDVLVVPMVAGVAPRLVKNWLPGDSLLAVDGGTQISGVVRDPAGVGVGSAQVQLALDGVPSTLATANAAGQFTVRAAIPTGAPDVTVDVTPPMATGLPRISGSSTSISTTSAITVQYSAALVRRDVGGTVIQRAGVAQPNAPVKIVGTIGAVATINGTVNANGELRIATTTTGAGAIPASTLAPAAPLFVVAMTQLGVGAFDLSTAVPATVDTPAPAQVTTQLKSASATSLPNAVIELAPVGPLALAGSSTIRGTSDAGGGVTLVVPGGGRFDVRIFDPLGRAGPAAAPDVPTASLASEYLLKKRLLVKGSLVTSGNPNPVGRAAVQILCTVCAGSAYLRPLAEGSTLADGSFGVAVADPGVQ